MNEKGEMESNARFIVWEDGSTSLAVGGEILKLNYQDHGQAQATAGPGAGTEKKKSQKGGVVKGMMGGSSGVVKELVEGLVEGL